CQQHDSYPHSF
nr:immunoglobulin light chain junction region [Macaca mulatta]MOV74612.1 immunoglobulin light chain junction region [Macaca mulatta]MOV75082.1 immunoglobulin light chain junction region [Macaca mulatta]MOV75286.1 immunoglobulin light chain junction region [Macaca mulatta]MOV75473.1 immunoglobulin light chain junction region [Macaca mulatta]